MAEAKGFPGNLLDILPFGKKEGGSSDSQSKKKYIIFDVKKNNRQIQSDQIEIGDYLIGSGLQADIIIAHEKAEDWFDLIITKKLNGFAIMIMPLADGMIINEKKFSHSEVYNGTLPIEIKKENITLFLRDPSQPRHLKPKLQSQSLGIIPLAAMGVGAILLIYAVLSPLFQSDNVFIVEQPVNVEQPVRSPVPEQQQDFKAYLQKLINAAGINPTLRLEELGNKVRVTGTLSQNQSILLESIMERADPNKTRIESRVSPIPSEMPADSFVAGVELQPEKFVIDPRGRRLSIGDEISSGWRIKEITNSFILIERGILTIEIPL